MNSPVCPNPVMPVRYNVQSRWHRIRCKAGSAYRQQILILRQRIGPIRFDGITSFGLLDVLGLGCFLFPLCHPCIVFRFPTWRNTLWQSAHQEGGASGMWADIPPAAQIAGGLVCWLCGILLNPYRQCPEAGNSHGLSNSVKPGL